MRFVVAVAAATLLLSACSTKPRAVNGASIGGPTEAPTKTLTWGEKHSWPDGLAIEVGTPGACKPSKSAMPDNIKRAVKVKITITNGTSAAIEVGRVSIGIDTQFAGAKTERVYDAGGGCDIASADGTVLPGKSFTYDDAYVVGADQGELQLTFEPSYGKGKAIYVGKA